MKRSVQTFEGKYQVLAVAFGDAGDQVSLMSGHSVSLTASTGQGVSNISWLHDVSAHARVQQSAYLGGLQLGPDIIERLVTCLSVDCYGVSTYVGMQVYSAGLDNNITVWDLRKGAESMTLKGHSDSITGLALNPEGTHLLSNAADNSLRVWDLRPYAPANRCEKIFTGHQHNYERNLLRCSWSSDGSKVCFPPLSHKLL